MRNKIVALLVSALFASNAYAAASDAVEELNELLRGEISAVETYRDALKKVGTEPDAGKLREALGNHEKAVQEIKTEISRLGGTPTNDSGAWGVWASTVTKSSKLFGDAAALKALKEGEEHGVKEYTEILEEDDVPAAFREKVKSTYLPRQRNHIALLDRMIDQAS